MSRYLTQQELEKELDNLSDFEVRSLVASECDCSGNSGNVSDQEDHTIVFDDSQESIYSDSDASGNNNTQSPLQNAGSQLYRAKSGRQYIPHPPRFRKRSTQNILRDKPGLRNEGIVGSILDSFLKFFTEEMIDNIVQYSNEEALIKNVPETDKTEILALFGVLISMGANDDTNLDYHDLFSKQNGRSIYNAAMSRKRFGELMKILRFDSKDTRASRRRVDKFAPIRKIFQMMNQTFLKYFIPNANVVVDEMLSLFRGRCSFKVFMKDKPGKYGILIRMLADCETRYVLQMEVYAGKTEDSTPNTRGPKEIVKRLVSPLRNSGRNVTTDRYYTSIDLAEDLYREFGLTLVGTLQKNRKHIPELLKSTKDRKLHSSIFAFTDPSSGNSPVTLVSYVTKEKPTKILLLLSTQHADDAVNDGPKTKSDINIFYNETKGGVDTIDQMARKYSTKRSTRRWPISIFYTLLDIAALNAYSLYLLNYPEWNSKKHNRRRIFLQELASALIQPNVERRAENINGLQTYVIVAIENILKRKVSRPTMEPAAEKNIKRRCYSCYENLTVQEKRKMAKTTIVCEKCGRHVCGKHSIKTYVCLKCKSQVEKESE